MGFERSYLNFFFLDTMLFSAHGFAEHKVFFQEYVDYVIEATLHTRFYPHFTAKKLKFTQYHTRAGI